MCCKIQEQSNYLHMHITMPSGIPVVAPVVELCDQLLVVISWQYSCLVEVNPGVPQAQVVALLVLNRGQLRITSWGTVNTYE